MSLRLRESDIEALRALGKEMDCGYTTVARLIIEKYLAERGTKSKRG